MQQALTRTDLEALGISPREVTNLMRDGVLVQPFRGVYVPADLGDDVTVRAAALARHLPAGAAVARTTAAWLHGLDVRPPGQHDRPPPLQCLVPASRARIRRRGVIGYQADLPESDVELVEGVPVTTLERTALDLARYLPPYLGLAALDALAHERRIDPAVLAERIERWRGERNVDQARRLISLCEPKTESFGESWLRLRIVDAGFPRPEAQIWIMDDDTGLYRLDLGWRKRRKAVEYDGVEFHSSPQDVARDIARREDVARRFGWFVLGVGRREVLGRSMELERAIGEMLGMAPLISRRAW